MYGFTVHPYSCCPIKIIFYIYLNLYKNSGIQNYRLSLLIERETIQEKNNININNTCQLFTDVLCA